SHHLERFLKTIARAKMFADRVLTGKVSPGKGFVDDGDVAGVRGVGLENRAAAQDGSAYGFEIIRPHPIPGGRILPILRFKRAFIDRHVRRPVVAAHWAEQGIADGGTAGDSRKLAADLAI